MQWSQIIVATLGASGIIGAAVIGIVYNKNLKLREEQNSGKQKAYLSLLKTLDSARLGKPIRPDAMNVHARQVVYFGSTGVLKAFGDYQQFIFSSFDKDGQFKMNEKTDQVLWMKLLGELMLQMRKDLGNIKLHDRISFRRKTERWHDTLRLTITDVDSYIPKNYAGRRGRKFNAPPVMDGGKKFH